MRAWQIWALATCLLWIATAVWFAAGSIGGTLRMIDDDLRIIAGRMPHDHQ